MKHKIEFREATAEDIPVIAYLADKIWKKHYITVISREQIIYMLEKFYSSDALTEQMKNSQQFYLVYLDGEITGYMSVTKNDPASLFLNKFYIDNPVQRKGTGTLFFKFILKKFNPDTIFLTVNRKNHTAINFYFKNGFVIDHVEDFDIGNGFLMEDFVMRWSRKKSG